LFHVELRDTPAFQTLQRGLDALGLETTAAQAEALYAFSSLLSEWSQRMNLTGHRTLEAIVDRLVLEACALASALPALASLADLGSGAGIPGIPVAILRGDCRVTLVESRERRHHFQRAIVRELGLSNVEPLLGRAEQLEPRPHSGVVAQAMAQPGRALAWMLPWAEPGGLLLLPLAAETPPPEHPEVMPEPSRSYQAPGGPERSLWIGRKR
jgi:16S rRNA (guanine527-N7)-methyltransferase